MAGEAVSSPGTQAIHHVVVNANKQIISSALVPVAALLAVAVGALSLLPSLAQAVWEVPHLFLLGVVITYGVFAQKNSRGGGGGGDGAKDGGGDRAWNSRYLAGEPLGVVASNEESNVQGGKPLSLPVRRLKPAQAAMESDGAGDGSDDGIGGAETDSSASTAGFWGAGPSPPSVLDAVCRSRKFSAAATAPPSTMSKGYYDSPVPRGDQSCSDDGEVTDWDDDEEEAADVPDEMAASPQRSYDHDEYNGDGNDDDRDMSADDEELFERVAKAGPEVEDEVDRKADEFIAKFREQIRLQRL